MKAPKMKKRETFYLALSMIAYLHKTIEEAPSLPRDVVNKKTRKLLIFFLSLSLCSTTLFSGYCREASLSHYVYHSHSTVIVFCSWSLTFSPKSIAEILQEKKSKKLFSLSTNPLLLDFFHYI